MLIYVLFLFFFFTATLPLPTIPPPPVDDLAGPAVPPRHNLKRYTPSTARDRARGTYHEVESDFEPHYLVQTADGNVFMPNCKSS